MMIYNNAFIQAFVAFFMAKAKTICDIMLAEHKKIHKLLEKFKKDLDKRVFFEFKWTLEKHFFVEEKVIFTVYAMSSPEESEDLFDVLKQHKDILWLLRMMEEDIEKGADPRTRSLSELLTKHSDFENDVLYPKLEKQLSKEQKQLIIDRAKEIIK